ncbi:septum formation initiator [Pontibacter ummariensis]|uniref:Septum formation initiator n=1 Tax=Pontibacter ummariensis TaxID=1610492 RepID=A0A239B0A3_9BACT|nr:septum formation initiator family protein [Pontibacter ummariensis]PRY16226.1 septum formation initiator [Pontibacter ummariensis]SNS01405.1 Septum formation initiator [Pontibacter ummariensis]
MLQRIPKIFRNFYFITTFLFIVWMLFFDSNDFITQYRMRRQLSEEEERKEYYLEMMAEVQKDREELMSNPELLEKFAREKYLMKRPKEDVFIIVRKED